MIEEAAWRLVPPKMPEDAPPWVGIALQEVKDENQARAYAWAQSLLGQLRSDRILRALSDQVATLPVTIADISAGFVPFIESGERPRPGTREHVILQFMRRGEIPIQIGDECGYTFGVVIGIADMPFEPTEFVDEIPGLVRLGNNFPVLCERRVLRQEAPPHPAGNATSSCFARPRKGKRYYSGKTWREGILIARHVLDAIGTAPGTIIPMTDGQAFALSDIDAATTIDAAILDGGTHSIPPGATSLAVTSMTLNGAQVSVRGKHRTFSADVLRIMDDSRYFGNMVAHRAFLNAHGSIGDSGALVTTDTPTKEAAGIYLGTTGGAFPEGLVQLMRQVTEYFEIDLFD